MSKKAKSGCLKIFLMIVAFTVFIIIAVGGISLLVLFSSLPSIEELTPSAIAETSKVYSLDGSLITEFHAEENREIIPFNKMSQHIKDAIISVEDKRFYQHQGVDYIRIIGALIADIRSGEIVEGGSTITQQYVKNVYFSPEQTLRRKINEAAISIQLERNYTKDKILEMYLNTVNFGSGSYGIEKASQNYFGVHADELTISQAALLAGLLRAPEIYSPFNNLEKAKDKRNLVLKLMYEQEFINSNEYLEALTEPIILNESQQAVSGHYGSKIAPYFIDLVKQQLYDKKFTDYDVFKGGLRIYTTLDMDLQKKAENAVKIVFPEEIEPSYSLISIDPSNGYIYSLLGGKDYSISKFNIATQGKRQPGSIFKTLVLMESLKQNISPNNKYNPNGPITIKMEEGPDWVVDNYGGKKFEGEMSVIDGTINSVNVVYAQLMMKVGAENVEELCSEMEIYDIGNNPAIALGGLETGVTPLDVCKIFSTLASGGIYNQPVCILKITDSNGNILYEYNKDSNENNHRILEEPISYYITKILERVINEGTGRGANIGRPAAGKTGTTSDYRDAWFGGYTPELATVVWIGHSESTKPMDAINERIVVGGTYPADIWREYMSAALENKPVTDFKIPDKKLVDIEVCSDSGLLPIHWCPKESLEWRIFIEGEEPAEFCDIHNKIEMPNIVGMNIEEARVMLEDLFFEINEQYEFDETYNHNIVFRQEPEAGNIIESSNGQKPSIILFISKGEQTFEIPDIVGVKVDIAKEIVNSLGLILENTIYDYNTEYDLDKVFKQEPAAGSIVTKSTSVTLYISKGENPESTVPNVIGMTEEDAINTLNTAGFSTITTVEGENFEENSNEKDKVFAQIPESDTTYNKSFEIIIKISKGIEVPDVIGMEKETAIDDLEGLGFIVNILPDPETTGEVINQLPAAGTYLNLGSIVNIELFEEEEEEVTEDEV
ncbi:MAG: PBP1A family penicillin-binding protein [Actinobacteria bacterium]|nr:PBP1A family penicillin-binding protein [Actinomycetota bacterium]